MEYLELDDPYLLSFIVNKDPDLENELELIVRNNRTTALLPATPAVYDLLRRYNTGEEVPAIIYSRLVKKIRGLFIEKRRNENDGNERVIRNGSSSIR